MPKGNLDYSGKIGDVDVKYYTYTGWMGAENIVLEEKKDNTVITYRYGVQGLDEVQKSVNGKTEWKVRDSPNKTDKQIAIYENATTRYRELLEEVKSKMAEVTKAEFHLK